MSDLSRSIETVKLAWEESTYYNTAEKWTPIFWGDEFPFRRMFEQLDVERCAELACGHGRHAEQLMRLKGDRVKILYCLDVIQANVDFTSRRLSRFPQVHCLLIEGKDFQPIDTGTLTAIYCYDAMVHFSPDIVQSYLVDAHRVLKPGGRVFLHHSNLDAPTTGNTRETYYGKNPNARNHMTLDIFTKLVEAASLRILETQQIDWGGVANLDRISLLERL